MWLTNLNKTLVSLATELYRKFIDGVSLFWFLPLKLSSIYLIFLSSYHSLHLLPQFSAPLHLLLHIFLWNSLDLSRRAGDAECWAHKFCLVWNRRWLLRTAGRFFITGAFLVPSTATTTCHQTHAGLRVYVYVFMTWRSKRIAASKKTELNVCSVEERSKEEKGRMGQWGVEWSS